MIATTISLLLLAATAEPKISIGQLEWQQLPQLSARGGKLDGTPSRQAIRNIIKKKQCNLPGATLDNFGGITVWFAMLVHPDGRVSHIAVQPVDCRPLETLVGAMAKQLITKNMIKPTGEGKPRWYGSRVQFNN